MYVFHHLPFLGLHLHDVLEMNGGLEGRGLNIPAYLCRHAPLPTRAFFFPPPPPARQSARRAECRTYLFRYPGEYTPVMLWEPIHR
eukprot:COSAG01_NODE_2730_length_7172_cov_35.156087_8_plen_86_part_00